MTARSPGKGAGSKTGKTAAAGKAAAAGAAARGKGRTVAKDAATPARPQPICLLVLGAHRSGTSALTRLLSLMGAALPRRLMTGNEGNETGHWEGARMVEYSDQLLAEFGSAWDDWRPIDPARLPVARRQQMKADIAQIVRDDYGDRPLIVVKDPRICRFAGLFIESLTEAGHAVLPVLAYRNPREVIDSLQKRSIYWAPHLTRTDAALLWLSHQLESEAATRGQARVAVGYDQVLGDWRKVVARIEAAGQFRFPWRPEDVAEQCDGFLDVSRRHQRYRPDDVHLDPELQGWVADTWEALIRLDAAAGSATGSALVSADLDRVAGEFRDALPLLGTLTAERRRVFDLSEARQRELDGQAADLTALRGEAAALQAAVEAQKNEMAGIADQKQHAEQAAEGLARQWEAARDLAQSRSAQLENLSGQIAQLEARNLQAHQGREAAESQSHQLAAEMEALKGEIADLRGQVAGKTGEVALLSGERDEAQALAARLNAGAGQMVGALNEARLATYQTHVDYRNSTSWRVTAPLRWLSSLVRGRAGMPGAPGTARLEDFVGTMPAGLAGPVAAGLPGSGEIIFFTICSRNFMAFARTLHQSLLRFHPGARLFVALCDDSTDHPPFVAADEPFEFLHLDDLGIPDWREMSRRYNVTEFNTAIKPFVFQHLFATQDAPFVVYFDPDIYVVDRLTEIEEAFAAGADVILTPHMLVPNERAEMNERRLLQYGIYNLGFVGIARTSRALDVVRWWGRRLERECIIKRDEGLFVDQKWADHFPAFFLRPHILHHPGYNIAYWNLSNRTLHWNGERWLVNGQPVRFLHFSGNNLDDPAVLSRHSGEHRADTIGEMKILLDEYREAIFANGHREFRKIPYAFNWGGASGFNEHTPKPAHEMNGEAAASSAPATRPANGGGHPASGAEVIRTAMDIVGGPGKLIGRTARAISRGDLKALRRGVELARSAAGERRRLATVGEAVRQGVEPDLQPWRKSVLVIEWKTPRPDSDSGSRTVFYTIEILTLLGYRVTFLPISLAEDGAYSQALRDIGVRCIDAAAFGSVREFLEAEGGSFDFIVLNRVNVVSPHMDQIKALCPQAQLIFNTVDLHYIRELRDAEMSGASTAPALETKARELAIVRDSALTIVLSHVEEEILRAEVPDARLRVMPLVFSDLDQDPPGFDARADILFIGSFPHKPNVDAVLHFADTIFPALRERMPDLRFHIVGSEPPLEVLNLARRPGIVVHGFVEDIGPLFRSVRLTVAPLRFGAGIKGKIATSLAFGVPCVCSPIAAEGMRIDDGQHVVIAETVEEWCDAIASVHSDRDRWTRISASARQIAVEEFSLPANLLRIAGMMAELDADARDAAFLRFSGKEAFDRFNAAHPDRLAREVAIEKSLLPATEGAFDIDGFCAVCGSHSRFTTSYMYSVATYPDGVKKPNWREHLACQGCGFTMRLRAALQLYLSRFHRGPQSAVYITEQATPLYRWLQTVHPGLVGSEYLGDACAPGAVKDGLRNEDLTRLTFADASFDAILSFDVLEHVADDLPAFRECFRTLRPGGTLLFTAPFAHDKATKVVRARVTENGGIEHIPPPEIHGNPVDPEGALCFRYFAWDVVADLRAAGFAEVEVMRYWSRDLALLGEFGTVIVARKVETDA